MYKRKGGEETIGGGKKENLYEKWGMHPTWRRKSSPEKTASIRGQEVKVNCRKGRRSLSKIVNEKRLLEVSKRGGKKASKTFLVERKG